MLIQPIQRTLSLALLASTLLAFAPHARAEPPPAGGLTALPEPRFEPVKLPNGGFEDQAAGWRLGSPEAWSIVAGPQARSGNAALRLDCAKTTPYVPGARCTIPDAGPGIYRLRLWARTDAVEGKAIAGARPGLEYQLANGQRAWDSGPILAGTRDWTQQELLVLVPPTLKPGTLAITLGRYGTTSAGQALFDDVQLHRLLPPPVEAFLRYPNYRGFLPANGPGRIRLAITVNDPALAPALRVEVTEAHSGRSIASTTLPPNPKEQLVEFDATPWPTGRYLLQVSAGAYRYPAYAIQKITPEQQRQLPAWIDEKQVLHLAGQPVFPLGLYNTTLKFATIDQAEFDRLANMAQAPVNFNINYFVWPNDTATRRRYLAEMQKHGLWFLDTVNNISPNPAAAWDVPILNELLPEANQTLATQDIADRYLTRLAQVMRDMPGHAGWYVMDEREFAAVPHHFHQYQVLRLADPGHPTYGVSNRPTEMHCWRDALDIFGLDPYPLMNMKAGQPLSLSAQWTRAGVEATHNSRPVWMVLQFFQGWSTDRWPTEPELRSMSLMAITEGARGLFYWSFGNRALLSVRDPQQRQQYWQRLLNVTREIKSLEPALVADDAPHLVRQVSDPRVRWRARLANGKCYLFAYLPADKRPDEPPAPTAVQFLLADGRSIALNLAPDQADWFAVDLPQKPQPR